MRILNLLLKQIFITLLFLPLTSHSQGTATNEMSFIYLMKYYYSNKIDLQQFSDAYLKRFDKDYNNYRNNEIEYSREKNGTINKIKLLCNKFTYDTVYVSSKITTNFGKYNKESQAFYFEPLPSGVYIQFAESVNFDEVNQGINSYIANGHEFNEIKMSLDSADKLLKERTIQSQSGPDRIDRRVYLKLHYSFINKIYSKSEKSVSPSKFDLKNFTVCYIHKIEVWSDECQEAKLLTVLHSKSQPPTEISNANLLSKQPLKKSTIQDETLILKPSSIYLLDSFFISSTQTCDKKSYFDITLKINKKTDGREFEFTIWTSSCMSISPGYIYTFTDFYDYQYPLMVNSVNFFFDKEIPYSIVRVNITDVTYEILQKRGIKKITLQVGPTVTDPGNKNYTNTYFPNCSPLGNTSTISWTLTNDIQTALYNFLSIY